MILDASAKLEATSDLRVCGDVSAAAGVTHAASAGVELSVFAGKGKSEELPNEFKLASSSQELFNQCFPFRRVSGNNSGSTNNDDPAKDGKDNTPNFDGKNGVRPSVSEVKYKNGDGINGASLWFNSNDNVAITPLSVGDKLAEIFLSEKLGDDVKCTLFDSFDKSQNPDGCANLANRLTPDLFPGFTITVGGDTTHLCIKCENL
ncbi:hypothetical protein ACHAPJ_008615 [Fusarium lateritium]